MLTSLSERVLVRNTSYQLDPLGHVADQTPADFEKMELVMRKVDPDVKVTIDVHDIKVRISGDTAIVTYSGTVHCYRPQSCSLRRSQRQVRGC
jgi:hypothetical protein